MVLLVDNYDSFTYNLYQLILTLGFSCVVERNDKLAINDVRTSDISHIVLSPGPGRPEHAGQCSEIVEKFSKDIPILGVCLGHQVIAQVFGARVIPSKRLMHGKVSNIHHRQSALFYDIANPFSATRYHSLAVDSKSIPDTLCVTASTEDGTVMSIAHKEYAVYGVQFHPESILTGQGKNIIKNFLSIEEVVS